MIKEQMSYTQNQMDIIVLKTQIAAIMKTTERLEKKVDSHFHRKLGLIFGMFIMGLIGLLDALSHAYNWF